jgi:SAM-dependent methyltransferase
MCDADSGATMAATVTLACIILLVAILIALAGPWPAASALAGGCTLVAGLALVVNTVGRSGGGTVRKGGGTVRGGTFRRGRTRARRPAARKGDGLFARLRASPRGEAAKRLKRFFRGVGNFTEGWYVAINGPPGDEATLTALLEAWKRHAWAPTLTPSDRGQKRLAEVADLLPLRQRVEATPLRYLDIGAGDGSVTAAIALDLGIPPARAIAADLYVPATENPAVEHVLVDGRKFPFGDETFGLVTMFMAAHHFADAPQVFAEAYRVSQPGARLILREHSRSDADAALYYDLTHGFYEVVGGEKTPHEWVERYERGGFAHYRTPAEWVSLVTEAGFTLDFEGTPRKDSFDTVLLAFLRK